MVKFTPESHHDYKALTNALERVRPSSYQATIFPRSLIKVCASLQVSEVAELVNESVRKKQNLEQLAELDKRLMGKYPVFYSLLWPAEGWY